MKWSIATLILLGFASCSPQEKVEVEEEEIIHDDDDTPSEEATGTAYDAALAERLGADDYGMKPYVMVFLYAGPNRDQDSAEVERIQRGHLDNINRLDSLGKLVLAGPFMDDSDLRGIFIFDVPTVEEAEALTATDPAIQSGRLRVEFKPWYGSAAVSQVGEVHRTIAKQNP